MTLRILVVSNLYPPHYLGGYELGCRDCVEGLRSRGHRVEVLTSDFRKAGCSEGNDRVARRLRFGLSTGGVQGGAGLTYWTRRDLAMLDATVWRVRPDAILVYNTSGLGRGLLCRIAEYPVPAAYFISDFYLIRRLPVDPWLAFWVRAAHTPFRRRMKALVRSAAQLSGLAVPPPDARRLIARASFTSAALRDAYLSAGYHPEESRVIRWGISPEVFSRPPRKQDRPQRLLYAGVLREGKGPHTAIEAMAALRAGVEHRLTLTLVGDAIEPDYGRSLRRRVREAGLTDVVSFRPGVPREQMPSVYAEHDVLLFTSIEPEAFAITLLEAMASGLAVVTTTTGGNVEFARHGENTLVFEPGNAEQLAAGVAALCGDPALYRRIRRKGHALVTTRHTVGRMVSEVEAFLDQVLSHGKA